ncbi:MAG: hypothetical protein F6K37_10420 [Moorea sp. SIO4E2]|uniref:hypothetical protein n=1 Tax=Moorena sp. SIO4E2 TaxID=2607826 RepID=UPI0013BDEAA1|nr:hypothetical protein [Moorena sp. SIO4E2]NEQ06347.1 hypothetical protein [Moorena sp. SIO4E2]
MAYWPRDRVQPSTFNLQPSTFNLQPSTFNLQPSNLQTFNRLTSKKKPPIGGSASKLC